MYIKIINPATNGKKAYSNRGSARQATNYLEGEAKKQGEVAVFFNSNRTDISGDEAVQMLDANRKGLQKEDAKFYSLVISPSAQELEHIGSDPQKLRDYTARVMQEYATNFVTKSGQPLSEKDLVWVATQHDERKHRGYDGAPSGQKKEGLQTHIHIMVSARDRQQKVTLNPLGSPNRFNRVSFMAKGNVAFEQQFGPVKTAGRPGPQVGAGYDAQATSGNSGRRRGKLTAEEMADSIRRRAAARDGRAAPGRSTGAGKISDEIRDKQLFNQVNKVNQQLPPDRQLEHNRVLQAARIQDYSKAFYGRLGQLGKDAGRQQYHDLPYEFLRTGKDPKSIASHLEADAKRDRRLLEQVDRLNKKLPEKGQLSYNVVLEIAREQDYSKAFYSRLNRIGRAANTTKAVREPHEFLRTGKVNQPANSLNPQLPQPPKPTGQQRGPGPAPYQRAGARAARGYQPSAARTAVGIGQDLSRALGTQGYTQDVRGDDERD